MNIKQAYNIWASQYDSTQNKTRDLEAIALRVVLENIAFQTCLEIGCGTGKNTQWLVQKADRITAIDFSGEMLAKAKGKVSSEKVMFKEADITEEWTFREELYDLVTFSLVLEHIENLSHVFREASLSLKPGGHMYVGELHPFKQYTGTKARFDLKGGRQVLECFTHHVSDFIGEAGKHGLELIDLREYFDDNSRKDIPRILAMLFRKFE